MKKPLPPILEDAEELYILFKSEKIRRCKERLHALYLLKSGQAKNRLQVASLLGVHRDTVGRWLTAYQEGGLQTLLDVYLPSGKKSSLPSDVVEILKHKLKEEKESFSSYKSAWLWFQQYSPSISYKSFHDLTFYKLHAKLKVPRKSHKKK